MAEENKKKLFAQWLEKIQQESWQLELIISGFVLFGILEAQKFINKLKILNEGWNDTLELASALGIFSLSFILTVVFIILLVHIILRSLWIGAIGLRYVSGDINYEKLNYSKKFTIYLKNKFGSFDNYIEKLEDWCSILFAYAFLIVFIFISFMLYLFWAFLFIELLVDLNLNEIIIRIIFILFGSVYVLFGLLAIVDFISLGWLKKTSKKYISNIYLWGYNILGYLTISHIYKPILLNFLDNTFAKRLFIMAIPIMFIIYIFPKIQLANYNSYQFMEDYNLNTNYYDDLREESLLNNQINNSQREKIEWFSLKEHINSNSYSSIFFTLLGNDKKVIDDIYYDGITPKEVSLFKRYWMPKSKEVRVNIGEYYARLKEKESESIRKIIGSIGIQVDSTNYSDSLSCQYYLHHNLKEKGLLCYYSTETMSKGKHEMKIQRISKQIFDFDTLTWFIPFWKFEDN